MFNRFFLLHNAGSHVDGHLLQRFPHLPGSKPFFCHSEQTHHISTNHDSSSRTQVWHATEQHLVVTWSHVGYQSVSSQQVTITLVPIVISAFFNFACGTRQFHFNQRWHTAVTTRRAVHTRHSMIELERSDSSFVLDHYWREPMLVVYDLTAAIVFSFLHSLARESNCLLMISAIMYKRVCHPRTHLHPILFDWLSTFQVDQQRVAHHALAYLVKSLLRGDRLGNCSTASTHNTKWRWSLCCPSSRAPLYPFPQQKARYRQKRLTTWSQSAAYNCNPKLNPPGWYSNNRRAPEESELKAANLVPSYAYKWGPCWNCLIKQRCTGKKTNVLLKSHEYGHLPASPPSIYLEIIAKDQ